MISTLAKELRRNRLGRNQDTTVTERGKNVPEIVLWLRLFGSQPGRVPIRSRGRRDGRSPWCRYGLFRDVRTHTHPSGSTSAASAPAGSTVVKAGEEWVLYQGPQDCGAVGNDPSTICLKRPDGSGRHKLLDQIGEVLHPDWSPDGTYAAFSIDGAIWRAAVDGSALTMVSDCSRFDACSGLDFPAWSPDGTSIAFTVYNGTPLPAGPPSKSAIAILNLATKASTVVVQTDQLVVADQARWSHDGTRLVMQLEHFDKSGTELGSSIGVVAASGGVPTPITETGMFGTYPDWNPTSDRIVFVSNDVNPAGGAIAPFLVNADGSELAPLSYEGSVSKQSTHPSWTPDGSRVVFVQFAERRLSFIDPAGSGLKVVDRVVTHPRLRPLP